MTGAVPRRTPCASCPFRCDVPSGVWTADEYEKLPRYDGEPGDQAVRDGGTRLFFCHQATGDLCAGWVGHRADPSDLLALRLNAITGRVDMSTFDYRTRVPLFSSGAEAAAHGLRDVDNPSPEAVAMGEKVVRAMRARNRNS